MSKYLTSLLSVVSNAVIVWLTWPNPLFTFILGVSSGLAIGQLILSRYGTNRAGEEKSSK